ncbi:sugar ABC transporter substrate-binding protein [Conexibacter sp. CPCC 206217]|uniref:sugar ABC transporter substrate-binding protein n=1 Tax=Conexibacter sp. CPCC 206217 TaxID=3064574 RepID=UPI00272042B0|nr:sugar ABC transporter substrate-binding protein [Conexibacter sp. CPCC 206217]MDO8211901.1 sugar ABC transporter substrate-binding protein [Conexibacter sp. CPCC 206217]
MFHQEEGLARKVTRSLLALTAVAAVALAGAGCGSSDSDSGSSSSSGAGGSAVKTTADVAGKRVILLTVTPQCDYCARATRAFEAGAARAGLSVEKKITNYDAAEQADQVNQAIAQRPDAIVYWPADATASIPSLNRMKAAKIPVIVTNSSPGEDKQDLWNAFTGPNDTTLGELAADAMIRGLEQKNGRAAGNIFVVGGQPGSPPAIQRLAGFERILKARAPDVKIVGNQPGNWDQTQATTAADGLFTANANKDIVGVYAQADNMAAGVIVSARRKGLDPARLVIVGGNCQPEGLRNIRSGEQYASVLQSPIDDGDLAARAVVNILSGREQPHNEYLPAEVITKANLATCAEGVG